MKSPLILPLTLIIAGVLAFMATTGILPPSVFRLWPVIFVILGVVGLISLSSEELIMDGSGKHRPSSKPAAKSSPKSKTTKKSSAQKKSRKR